jgi:hypothetical protein
MNTLLCTLAVLLALLCVPAVALAWAMETPPERARRWHRNGWSQARIASRLGCTRYRVRVWLAA